MQNNLFFINCCKKEWKFLLPTIKKSTKSLQQKFSIIYFNLVDNKKRKNIWLTIYNQNFTILFSKKYKTNCVKLSLFTHSLTKMF